MNDRFEKTSELISDAIINGNFNYESCKKVYTINDFYYSIIFNIPKIGKNRCVIYYTSINDFYYNIYFSYWTYHEELPIYLSDEAKSCLSKILNEEIEKHKTNENKEFESKDEKHFNWLKKYL